MARSYAIIPLALAALMLPTDAAQASAIPLTVPFAFEEEFEIEEEGESEEAVCGEAEEEFEVGELDSEELEEICEEVEEDAGAKKAGGNSVAPVECLLRTARASVVANTASDKLLLTISYSGYEPTNATVGYGAGAGKGSQQLGSVKRHLGMSGVLHLTKSLGDSQMDKVEKTDSFTVQMHIPTTPRDCRPFQIDRLKAKRASKHRVVWSQTT